MTYDPTPTTIEHLLAHRQWLRALAFRLVREQELVDDLEQDTWLAALRRPPDDPGATRSWLRSVVKNLVRDRHRVALRRSAREEAAAARDAVPATADVAARAELQRELTRHVLALDEPYRTTILLRFFEELPPREVAARMHVPVETVRTRTKRAVERLRESLTETHGGGEGWRLAILPLIMTGTTGGPGTATVSLVATSRVASALAALQPFALPVAAVALLAVAVALVFLDDVPTSGSASRTTPRASGPTPSARPGEAQAPSVPTEERVPQPARPTSSEEADGTHRSAPIAPRDVSTVEALPGMARLDATDRQPMGMDEAELKKALTQALGYDLDPKAWERFAYVWREGFLFSTPRHTVVVDAVDIGRFEVTNAQWKVFLDAPLNVGRVETPAGMTLRSLVMAIYRIDADDNPVDAQRAGLYLYRRNEGRLMGAFNPAADPKWEPLKAWVDDAQIPAGTKIEYTHILPPPYWQGGEVPDDELGRPVRFVSWNDARWFCRWAGLHLPLEREWERAARGDEGRLFAWGDAWNPKACVWRNWKHEHDVTERSEPVTSLGEFATPEGVHHLAGNVSELVFDFATTYPGSKSPFKFNNAGMLARGGSWGDERYVMLAADRIWDIGQTQIGPDSRADGMGFRYAAYPQDGRDLALELATYSAEFFRVRGAALWLPYPIGLGEKDREDAKKRQPLQGFALARTAGWMHREVDPNAAHQAFYTGAAQGIALLPIKGIAATYLKSKNEFEKKLPLDKDETALVGALLATDSCKLQLVDEGGAPLVLDMGDTQSDLWAAHDLGFTYQVGAWLVLRGERVAVYAGDGSRSGVYGAHLKGKPIGYLPEPWSVAWAITEEASPAGGYAGGVATLSAPIPQLEKDGSVKTAGKAAVLTVRVPATFD